MENHSSRRWLFGELLQATGIDPLKEMTELAGVIGNIEQWLYDDNPNSICDVPKNNLTREEEVHPSVRSPRCRRNCPPTEKQKCRNWS